MKAATKATILHKVMKKKAISSIGLRAKLFAPQGKLSMQIKIRALQQQFKGKASVPEQFKHSFTQKEGTGKGVCIET